MHALIVVAHPDPDSFTHRVAAELARGIADAPGGHTAEIADLAAEDFDPRYNNADRAGYGSGSAPPPDVLLEQQRIDRCQALVLVYPVYWWSFPALLKGWIDRVFSNGWAYRESPGEKLVKLLGRLPVHLVAIGGADAGTYDRHGYLPAMRIQIEHGIFDYCGAPVAGSRFLLDSHAPARVALLEAAHDLGRGLFIQQSCGSGSAHERPERQVACSQRAGKSLHAL
ncbi:MAG: dehydrogenase [Ramlibacter sp.]|jgi:NAD(P)H dehydrogenase (quinone)|nr:dehydrogenase [Ramlibacter sp.]